MPTWRGFNRGAYQCGLYEAQDVIGEIDDIDLLRVEAKDGLKRREQWQKNLVYHDPTGMLMHLNPGLEPVRLAQDYELFVIVCQRIHELLYVNAIQDWKSRCRASVCWVDEMWAADVPKYRHWLRALEQFDHICVGYRGTVGPLSKALGRQCHWMPGGVDAIRFSPDPLTPPRAIDVYSVGRRHEGIHRRLLDLSRTTQFFYLHDTLKLISTAEPIDDREHREMYANVAKRSRFFLVAPGKAVPDEKDSQAGQSELGFRYYEGAAAGAVLLGQAPQDESFQTMFGWPDSVIEVAPDGSDVGEAVRKLTAQPDRLRAASLRNAEQSLRRHDWVYRWKSLLDLVGLAPSSGMNERMLHLDDLASMMVENTQ
jgi:hypothetical protein